MSAAEPLWSVAQLAEHLDVCEALVYRHANCTDPAAHWPNLRVGRQIKFTPEQVAQIKELLRDRRADPVTDRVAPRQLALVRAGVQRLERAQRKQSATA